MTRSELRQLIVSPFEERVDLDNQRAGSPLDEARKSGIDL